MTKMNNKTGIQIKTQVSKYVLTETCLLTMIRNKKE